MKKRIVSKIVEVIEDDGRWLDPVSLTYYYKDELEDVPDVPKGLDEAARLYAIPHYMKDIDREHIDEYPYDTGLEAAFKAGAEWAFGQGYSVEDRVRDLPMKYLPLWCEKADPNDKVIVQIRKK